MQNLAPSLAPMGGDQPVHQQKADTVLSYRPYVVVLASVVAFSWVYFRYLHQVAWDDELPTSTVLLAALSFSFFVAYVVGRLILSVVRRMRVESTAFLNFNEPNDSLYDSLVQSLCPNPYYPCIVDAAPLPRAIAPNLIRDPPKTVYECLMQVRHGLQLQSLWKSLLQL